MGEERIADEAALNVVLWLKDVKRDVNKLELKTLRELQRACEQVAAECRYYVPVRLLQGGAKSQHRKEHK